MATVSITVPDALVPRVRAALRARHPEVAALGDVAAFREITARFWRSEVIAHETGTARDTAEAAVRAAIATTTGDAAGIT